MKKVKRIVAVFLIMTLCFTSVSWKWSKAKDYTNLGCVNWVKDRAKEKLGISLPATGMNEFGLYGANAYWNNLSGYTKGSEPAANSLAVWKYNNGSDGQGGRYGHVGFVESVNGNQVTTTEGGCPGYSYNGHSGVICRTQDKSKMATLGGCSQLLGYIYLDGNNTMDITFSDQKTIQTEEHNASVYVRINNNRRNVSAVGCYLYDVNGQYINTYREACNWNTSYVNYTCDFNSDMKISLLSGTDYKYILYAIVEGKEYKTPMGSFRTKGTTPVSTSISFRNQRVNFTTTDNAELYVYIDNPNKLVVQSVGCRLYDNMGTLVKSYSEVCGLSTSYVNYYCNFKTDVGYTLQPSRVYEYELFAIVDGKEYQADKGSFCTKDISPTFEPAPTIMPESSPTPTINQEPEYDINNVIVWALNVAMDDSHGYSQSLDRRWGIPDYDCSSLVISAFRSEGFNLAGATNTKNMKDVFVSSDDFEWIPRGCINLSDSSSLLPGDVLLNEGVHTELYAGFGTMVGAHGGSISIYDESDPGDSNGEEISIVPYSDKSWTGILRYMGAKTGTEPILSASPVISPTPTTKPSQPPIQTCTPSTPESPSESSETPIQQITVGKPNISYSKGLKAALDIKFSKARNAEVYQVICSTSSSFSNARVLWTNKNRAKIKKLKRKKKYYVKVRGYRRRDGVYGKWSSKRRIKTK